MRFTKNEVVLAIMALATLAVGPSSVLATPITFGTTNAGVLNIGNFSVSVPNTNACIDFYNGTPNASGCATPATSSITEPSDPTVFGVNGTAEGATLADIANPAVIGQTILVTNANIPGGNISGTSGVTFTLLSIQTPTTPQCSSFGPGFSGVFSCVITGSPFVFSQTGTGNTSSVSLSETDCAFNTGSSGGTNCSTGTLYTASFTAQFTEGIQALNTQFQTNGITDSASATFTPSPTPEPMSFILFGSGLVGVSLVGRRNRNRRKS